MLKLEHRNGPSCEDATGRAAKFGEHLCKPSKVVENQRMEVADTEALTLCWELGVEFGSCCVNSWLQSA